MRGVYVGPRTGMPKSEQFSAKRTHKYDLEDWHASALLFFQGGLCLCCKAVVAADDSCIDHDHDTGDMRGILCNNCNTLLGRMGDSSAEVARRSRMMLDYLDRSAPIMQSALASLKKKMPGGTKRSWRRRWASLLATRFWYLPETEFELRKLMVASTSDHRWVTEFNGRRQ